MKIKAKVKGRRGARWVELDLPTESVRPVPDWDAIRRAAGGEVEEIFHE